VICLPKYGKVTSSNFGSNSRDNYLLLLYIVAAIIFFYSVSLNQRNYQDVWILDGIAFQTVLFICFSLFIGTLIRENRKVVIFAAIFLFAVNIIPGLKYQYFSGCYDTPSHYKFTNEIVILGSVPETEYYSETYGGNPAMHILMSCVSIVSGISINDVFKFVIPALFSFIPLIIYVITKDSLSDTLQKYTIFASILPILPAYIVWGTNLGMIPFLLLITMFLRGILTKRYKIEFGLLFLITGFGLIISHAVSSFFAAFLLMCTPPFFKLLHAIRPKSSLSLRMLSLSSSIVPPLLFVVLLVTWWTNVSTFNLENLAVFVGTVFAAGPMTAPIPTRFYQIPFIAQIQTLAVHHLGSFTMLLLSLFGLFVFLRKYRRKELSIEAQTLYLFFTISLGLVASFLSFQFVSGFGTIEYTRFIYYSIPLCIPLAGLILGQLDNFLKHIYSKIARNIITALVLFGLVLICLIQFFPYQPLIPKANVISSNLPNNEYIDLTIGSVNTPYQITMISFAERHNSYGLITSDATTRYQIYGFSNHSFFSRHIYHSPLDSDENLQWDLFLLHTKKAAPFQEKVEYRTEEKIESLRLTAGNIIYDNGESFIIAR